MSTALKRFFFLSTYTMYVVQGHLHASIRHKETDLCTLLLGYASDALTYTKLYVVVCDMAT